MLGNDRGETTDFPKSHDSQVFPYTLGWSVRGLNEKGVGTVEPVTSVVGG